MLTRIGLFLASIAAAATLVVSAVALGLWPGTQPVANTVVAAVAASPDPSPTPQVDTIYVAPPAPQQTITVHRVERVAGGEGGDGGHEGGNDD